MNTVFTGTLFDGETLTAHPIRFTIEGGRLISQSEGHELDVALADVLPSSRLAALPRYLHFSDGRIIETEESADLDALLTGGERAHFTALVHWLEAQEIVAAAGTLLLVAMIGAVVWWGLPVLARRAAMAVPDAIEKQAGQTALLTLNRVLGQSRLEYRDQYRVREQLTKLLDAGGLNVRPDLVFCSMGREFPNAFALPGGTIVISDELVALATDDGELAAVLAHEIGHWQKRHGLQSVLRSSTALLVVSGISGDLSTLTSFAGTIPFMLLQRGYSREFEEEADAYTVDLLQKASIDLKHFESILTKLQNVRPKTGQDFTYLSTHPSTAGRIQALRAAQSTARPGTKSAPDISEKH